MTNREKLRDLIELLDEAPLDMAWLRAQLEDTSHLPDAEVDRLLESTLARLHRVQWALCLAPAKSTAEQLAHERALDWLATARATLVDYTLN